MGIAFFGKGGSTSLKAWAAFHGEGRRDGRLVGATLAGGNAVTLLLERNRSNEATRTHVDTKARHCDNLAEWNRRFRFAVVRHPLHRVVSAFHEKVEVGCLGADVHMKSFKDFQQFCTLPTAQRWPAFVGNLSSGAWSNSHVKPQVVELLKVGSHQLQAIVHLEELEARWPWILERSRFRGPASERVLMHANSMNGSTSNRTIAYLSDPLTLARLLQYYREDLRALRYRAAEVADASVLAAATRLQQAKRASHEWGRGAGNSSTGNASLAFVHLVLHNGTT